MKRLARTDLAIQSKQLLNQSVWCGLVIGLVVLLTILNVLPPIEVQYLVSGKLIASPVRAAALQQSLTEPNLTTAPIGTDARLKQLTLLDNAVPKQVQHFDARQQYLLVELESIWRSRCDHDQFQQWIDSIARNQTAQVPATLSEDKQELLLTQWQLEAIKHYQAHQEFLGEPTGRSDSVAQEKGVFQLASTGHANGSTTSDSEFVQTKQQLAKDAQLLESRFQSLSEKSKSEQKIAQGTIELTDGPKVQPRCRPIPVVMAISVLIIGLAVGSSASWLQLRLQSGGVYDPQDVSQQLARKGLPEVANLSLGPDEVDGKDWISAASHKASSAGRSGGRNFVLLSESLLAIWVLLIVGRICFDPLWRSLLWDSPLGALGRLVTGMP